LCWMFCAAWDGLMLHLVASHDRIEWTRPSPRCIEARSLPLGPTESFDMVSSTIVSTQAALATPTPKRLRFVNSLGGFDFSDDLEEGLQQVPYGNEWQNEQD